MLVWASLSNERGLGQPRKPQAMPEAEEDKAHTKQRYSPGPILEPEESWAKRKKRCGPGPNPQVEKAWAKL